jgi:hypothetical protein
MRNSKRQEVIEKIAEEISGGSPEVKKMVELLAPLALKKEEAGK